MAGKHIYSKSFEGVSDFIYVDLLPDVRRSRQFNVNVIAALFLGVALSFILIYMPYRTLTEEFEELNSLNNDLNHELILTNEEFVGHEINLDNIIFEEKINNVEDLRVNFNNYLDDVELLADLNSGNITTISYTAENSELEVTIITSSQFVYSIINNDFLELDWVTYSKYTNPTTYSGILYTSTYKLGVDTNVE